MENSKRLVLVGAGHAHLETITAIPELMAAGYDVTVISLGRFLYYSGMGPGLLSGVYSEDEVRFDIQTMVESRGGHFIAGKAERIDAESRMISVAGHPDVPYDVVSCAVGSVIPTRGLDTSAGSVYTAKPIENLLAAREHILELLESGSVDVVVSGGGAAGVELSSNASTLGDWAAHRLTVTLLTDEQIAHRFIPAVRRRAIRVLEKRGVRFVENAEVVGIRPDVLELKDSTRLHYDVLFLTTGTAPPTLFSDSGLPVGESGGLLVNKFLQCTEHPEIFGGGDCIDFEPRRLLKIGVYAVRENEIILKNLFALSRGEPLTAFVPQKRFHLALNMGRGYGISHRTPWTFGGPPAFALKDSIDRKFMRKYQQVTQPKG